ncbi:MAG: family 16 glycosylhydrolase [Acidimicrobiia bacterium]|nr:family 16 glycosylhydrolase [Acidimicrobiia bacterium]
MRPGGYRRRAVAGCRMRAVAAAFALVSCALAACTSGGGQDGRSASSGPEGAAGATTSPAAAVAAPATPGLSCGGGVTAGTRSGPGTELGAPVRIMPLGDSITIGMHGTGADWQANKSLRGGYRARLEELLDGSAVSYEMVGGSDAVDPREQLPCGAHEGHGGWCARGGDGDCYADDYVEGGDAGLVSHVAEWMDAAEPDVVLLHAGTNDIGSGRGIEALAVDYAQLVEEIFSARPDVYLFVSALHIAGRDDVNEDFNERLRDVVADAARAHRGRAYFVDTYAGAAEPLTGDDANGLHPSLATYEVMGQNWFDAISASLPGLFPVRGAGDAAPADQVAAPPVGANVQPMGATGAFQLVAQQEFDGPSLDTATWTLGPPWGGQFCQGREHFTDNAFDVSDGLLRIFFRQRDEPVDHCGIPRTYDTAMLQSKGKLTVQSGQYLEFRLRAARGEGLWSIAWILPESWPDDACRTQTYELDVFEHLGKDPVRINQSAHVRGTCEELEEDQALLQPGGDFTATFHVIGVDWGPEQVTYYIDGVESFRSSKFAGHDEPGFIVLNGFLGRAEDDWAGPESASTPETAEFQVDYVRVWDKA